MSKILIKMILILGGMLAVPYLMMGGDMPSFVTDFMPSASVPEPKGITGISNAVTDKEVTVYQWVDAKGVKHYSSTVPENQQVDTLQLRPNTNLVKAVRPQVEVKQKRGSQVTSIGKPLANPYSIGGAKKILDDARGLQDMINKRYEQQQKSIDR